MRVSRASLAAIAVKVTSGCEYILAGRYVEPPYGMRTFFVEPTGDVITLFSTGEHMSLGPGFRITRMAAEADNPLVVLYRGVIWGRFAFQTAVDLESPLTE